MKYRQTFLFGIVIIIAFVFLGLKIYPLCSEPVETYDGLTEEQYYEKFGFTPCCTPDDLKDKLSKIKNETYEGLSYAEYVKKFEYSPIKGTGDQEKKIRSEKTWDEKLLENPNGITSTNYRYPGERCVVLGKKILEHYNPF